MSLTADSLEQFGEEKFLSLQYSWRSAVSSCMGAARAAPSPAWATTKVVQGRCLVLKCRGLALPVARDMWDRLTAGTDQSRHALRELCSPLYQIHHFESSKHTETLKSTFRVQGVDTNERPKPKEEKHIFLNYLAIFSDTDIFFTDSHFSSFADNPYIP